MHGETAILFAILALVGASVALRSLLDLLQAQWVYFIRPGKRLRQLGDWAVITGATNGIGKAYASALAAQGFNLVLVNRSRESSKNVAAALQNQYGIEVKILVVDLAKADEQDWSNISAETAPLSVGLLVNCAGVAYNHAEYFETVSQAEIDAIIKVNVIAVTQMCKIFVPRMKSQKRGAIVNVGSGSATYLPSYPLYAVYSASKAYVDRFSRDLAAELAASGVTVENQAPFYVATKMSKIRTPTLQAPAPETWVAAALKQIGHKSTASPYWVHAAMASVLKWLPTRVLDAYLLSLHKRFRIMWYKKQERMQKQQ